MALNSVSSRRYACGKLPSSTNFRSDLMMKLPVYRKPVETFEVMSNQSNSRKYEVSFGEVDWGKNGQTEYAVYNLVLLLKDGRWQPQYYAAHILVMPGDDGKSDFDKVMEKMNQLKAEFLT